MMMHEHDNGEMNKTQHIPMIDVILDLVCSCLTMLYYQELIDPSYEMIVEPTLDQLMEDVQCDKLTDIRTREVICERLQIHS